VASLGEQLKQAREQRGVGLDEVAQSTKIGTRFLRALEADRYDQLPGGIFNKGFIRAYARAVGLDEEKAIAEYIAATEPTPVKTESSGPLPPRIVETREEAQSPDSGDLPWGVFAIVLILAALGLAGWGFYSRESRQASKLPTPPVSESAPSVSTGSASSSPQETSNVASSTSARSIPGPTPAASAVNKPKPVAGKGPEEAAGTASEPAANAAHYFSVRVNVREDSWLSISADGKVVLEGRFPAPTQKSVRATKQIVVRTGNAGGTDFEFNGRALPSQGESGEVKTLIFGAGGLEAVQGTTQPASPQP